MCILLLFPLDLEGFTAESVVPLSDDEEVDKAAERRRIRRNKKLRKRGYVSGILFLNNSL